MSTQYKTLTTRHIATLAGTALLPLVVAIGLAPSPVEANFLIDTAEAQQGQGQGQGGGRDLLNIGRGKGNGFGAGGEGRTLESDIFRDAASGSGRGQGQGQGQGGSSDRGGKPDGTGGGGGDNAKGDDYGDIVVILRDDDGTPILDDNGNVQPCLVIGCTEEDTDSYTQLVEVEEGDFEMPEGIIPVEFGRLNVARSPESVVEHSLTELLSKLDGEAITAETLADMTDEAGRLLVTNDDGTVSTIDSPLENFAFYVALIDAAGSDPTADSYTLSITTSPMGDDPVESFSMTVDADVVLTLAASAFSAASDKYGDLTVDEIMNITSFVGLDAALSSLVDGSGYEYTTTIDPDDDVTSTRESLYDTMIWVLAPVEGTDYFEQVQVNLLEVVPFNTVPSIDVDSDGIDTFTQQADDAVQVLEYVHDFSLDVE
ncbi:hypothetical protein RAN53_12540 [Halomonas sp. SSL-5]|uniref:hypothetical protein n=1 Tax=Halomonas sp. SSL-5 TaxID=3065855 RepID=UPI00273A17DF|nr:hypothetical protein [Halomonas sp. SSL-5]MDY7117174.1 hypothetical protein [Halomonas sp. SSL-5]